MFPLNNDTLEQAIKDLNILEITSATIRQVAALASRLEEEAGEDIIHLEIGNPGLDSESVGIEAEIKALRDGVANKYPDISGIKPLKENGAKFIKAFMDVDINPEGIIPTVGSMQGSFTLMILLKQRLAEKDTLLMLYPGFPAQRHQAKLVGINLEGFDIYQYRGKKLEAKLEEYFKTGRVTAMLYSNPNNPAWTNLTDEELEIIGRLATKYDVIVLEDLAYMGMDFRQDFSHPFEKPFISTVAKYTDNYILLLSASKIFSYAGQRIAMVCMSNKVYDRRYEFFEKFYDMPRFGDAYTFGVLYCASSGTTHSAQYAMAEMLGKAADGELDFIGHTREYGRRAGLMKKSLEDNGFEIIYSMDGDSKIADGFFFTVGYGNMKGGELQKELLRYGISSISLPSTGSQQEGVRVTVSMISDKETFDTLDRRLRKFHEDHQLN